MGSGLRILLSITLTLALLWVGRLVLIPVVLAGFLAISLAPVVDLLERHRVPRALGAILALAAFTAALFGVGQLLYARSVELAHAIPDYSHELRGMVQKVKKPAEQVQEATQKVLSPGPEPARTVRVSQPFSWTQALRSLGALGEVLLAASFVPFLAYFFLSWQRRLIELTVRLFGREQRPDADVALGLMARMVRRFLIGNVILGAAMAGLDILLFWQLGIPNFVMVGVVAGFVNLVPYLGGVLAPLLPLLAGAGHLHMTGATAIVLSQLTLHIFVMNVAYAKVVGARLQLNPLVGTLALLVWSALWGPVGLVLGIPLTAAIKIGCDRSDRLQRWGDWLGE